MNNCQIDEIQLLTVIRDLCTKQIRQPLTIEQVKYWLKQFDEGKEKLLGLLILRHLIYRTTPQLDSAFRQALKSAAMHFTPKGYPKEDIDWRGLLNGRVANLDFTYGPPKQGRSRPGKSGEIISRQLKFCDPLTKFKLSYPHDFTELKKNQRYLIIDDGTFTGHQLCEFLSIDGKFLAAGDQCGIVVGLAHEEAIKLLGEKYPNTPLFYGERITHQECFKAICGNWIEDDIWPFAEISPFDLYHKITKRAKFSDNLPLGYGELGCMVAYEHGIPDNSLQLLWDTSKNWKPLVPR
ncbi:MAG: hypothetical protein WAZ34_06790 [Rhodocyclaceae bacterium]